MTQAGAHSYDVVVVGGGPAGLAAAVAATDAGARTLLLEGGPFLGSELVSGLPLDGCLNARGEWIVGGILRELLDGCAELDGLIGPVCDWRQMWAVCVDPEALRLAIVDSLQRHRVELWLNSLLIDVVHEDGRVRGVIVANKSGRSFVTAKMFIDGTGDADLATLAGASFEKGGSAGELQPITLVFRMGGVDGEALLDDVATQPQEYILGENSVWGLTPAACAVALRKAGQPFVALSATSALLGGAIASGEMFACAAFYMWPTSRPRRELGFNVTRLADVDGTNTEALSASLPLLTNQVRRALRFARRIPGLEHAYFAGTAARIGVRETRRIVGESVLTVEDVIEGRKREDGIAKGGHHVDVHGRGTDQVRVSVKDGRSYDIPYGCLIPLRLQNVLVAGRCFSSTREANGSARVMGQCLATGEAAGAAAAMAVATGYADVRQVPVGQLRQTLRARGAVLEGTA